MEDKCKQNVGAVFQHALTHDTAEKHFPNDIAFKTEFTVRYECPKCSKGG